MDFSGALKVAENHSFYLIVLEMVRRQISQYFVFFFVLSFSFSLSVFSAWFLFLSLCLSVCVMYVVIYLCVKEREKEVNSYVRYAQFFVYALCVCMPVRTSVQGPVRICVFVTHEHLPQLWCSAFCCHSKHTEGTPSALPLGVSALSLSPPSLCPSTRQSASSASFLRHRWRLQPETSR